MANQIIEVGDVSLNNKGFSNKETLENEWQVPPGGGVVIGVLLSIPIWAAIIFTVKLIWKW